MLQKQAVVECTHGDRLACAAKPRMVYRTGNARTKRSMEWESKQCPQLL